MSLTYEKIPADASLAMPDEIMDLMEPYQYDSMIPFSPQFLSGFGADQYQLDAQERLLHAETKMKASAHTLLHNTISGYVSIHAKQEAITKRDTQSHFALLPIWVYRYQYQDQIYPFYINGQTGKIVGKTPIVASKVWLYGLTLYVVLLLIGLSLWSIF
jgi:hypothetical protein